VERVDVSLLDTCSCYGGVCPYWQILCTEIMVC